jgi:hypothetical protein
MSFPTLREMQLQMEVDRLRAELRRAESKMVHITRDYLNSDMMIHDNKHYRLNPYIEVQGNSATQRGENFIMRWKRYDEESYNQILYKADFVTITPGAADHILEDMMKQCLHHIIMSHMAK